jgi:hypothetical protein
MPIGPEARKKQGETGSAGRRLRAGVHNFYAVVLSFQAAHQRDSAASGIKGGKLFLALQAVAVVDGPGPPSPAFIFLEMAVIALRHADFLTTSCTRF